jgi:homoserine kinase
MKASVTVEVAASSANLGPGFDSLGLALDLFDRIEARFVPGDEVTVSVQGESAGDVPLDGHNLVARVVRTGLAALDESGEMAGRGLALTCTNVIPHGRGLGSSAAAIVGGLVVAAHLAGQPEAMTGRALVALATRLEGHPDNVAAVALGGATVAWMAESSAGPVGRATRLEILPGIVAVLAIPSAQALTSTARGALPETVSHGDAAFNVGRAALLVHALANDPMLLMAATEDRLHQGQRRSVYPQSMALVEALRAEKVAATISGAGPSVISLGVGDPAVLVAAVAGLVGPEWRVQPLQVASRGVRAV